MSGQVLKMSDRILHAGMALVLAVGLCLLPASAGTAWAAPAQAGSEVTGDAGDPATTTSVPDQATTTSVPDQATASVPADGEVTDSQVGPSTTDDRTDPAATAPEAVPTTLTPQYVTTYDLWVGGTQVTIANKDDILAGSATSTGKVSYDPSTSTLYLGTGQGDTVTISGTAGLYDGAAIKSGVESLHLTVRSDTTLDGATCSTGDIAAGIYATGSLIVTGSADLAVTGGTNMFRSAGIYAPYVSAAGVPHLTADGGAGAALSAGILCEGDTASTGFLVLSDNSMVYANGGAGTVMSDGVSVSHTIATSGTARLRAVGEQIAGDVGISTGVVASYIMAQGDSGIEAYGGMANQSCGISLSKDEHLADSGILLTDSATLTAQGTAATQESIGIQNATDCNIVVRNDTQLQVISGTASADDGTSTGITGKLIYDGGDTSNDYATVSSGKAAVSRALGVQPSLIDAYRWKTDSTPAWQYTTPYSYTGKEISVTFAPATFPLWVGGVQVNMTNKDDVLAGTANEGKVRFIPSDTGGADIGTLALDGADIEGVADTHKGAGIYSTGRLTLALTGTTTVAGASVAGGANDGMTVSGLTIGGTGTLDVTSAEPSSDSVATALNADISPTIGSGELILKDSVTVEATAGNGSGTGVYANDVLLQDSASLTAIGGISNAGKTAAKSYGLVAFNALTVSGNGNLVATAREATTTSIGISGIDLTVSDSASLTATGGRLTGALVGNSMSPSAVTSSYGFYGYTSDGPVITGGTLLLSTEATTGYHGASLTPIDPSGYTPSYQWRLAATDALTPSTQTAYAYDKTQTYVEIVPGASPAPTPTSGPSPTPQTGDQARISLHVLLGAGMLGVVALIVATVHRRRSAAAAHGAHDAAGRR